MFTFDLGAAEKEVKEKEIEKAAAAAACDKWDLERILALLKPDLPSVWLVVFRKLQLK